MRRAWIATGAALVGTVGVLVFGGRHVADTAQPWIATVPDATEAALGAASFANESFGGLSLEALETHAVPWRLASAALVLQEQRSDREAPMTDATVNRVIGRFGFLPDAVPVNLPEGARAVDADLPLGLTYGAIAPMAGVPVAVANLGCASCHAGVTYTSDGRPDPERAWLGAPNTSLDLEAYVFELTTATRAAAEDPDAWIRAAQDLHPEMGWRERQTLRWLVLPLAKARLSAIGDGSALPFPNGYPGATNGVAALKHALGLPLLGGGPGDAGVVSVPELADRDWRTSLLVDGSYARPGTARLEATESSEEATARREDLAAITTFFTVPSMGVDPEDAANYLGAATKIFSWLGDARRPQPFPRSIDPELAEVGARLYAAECAACHGSYVEGEGGAELSLFPNWAGDVGTDPLRATAFTAELANAVNASAYGDLISAEATGTYVAPLLSGVWATAPYLHNGSVPSVWALLTPEDRPDSFDVGGHALDFGTLGVRLDGGPEGYVPFSTPKTVDTAEPGLGNEGHIFGADLDRTEKLALIEYLKRL